MSQYINFFIRKQIKDEIAFIPWGAVHCGIVTISRKDFEKYYTRLT